MNQYLKLERREARKNKQIEMGILNTCHYCGITGPRVTGAGTHYVGGLGEVHHNLCTDKQECFERIEAKKQRR